MHLNPRFVSQICKLTISISCFLADILPQTAALSIQIIQSTSIISHNSVSCWSVAHLPVDTSAAFLGKPQKPVPFSWFVPQWGCRFEPTTSWQAWTHKNWFYLAVGSPWQFRSLTPHHPLIDLLGFWILFPSILLISTRILSDQPSCPGSWTHSECSGCFFFTLIFQRLALSRLMRLWYSVCHGEPYLVRVFVDEAF